MSFTSKLQDELTSSIWYIGIVRYYDSAAGFRIGCMLKIGGQTQIIDLESSELAKYGPYRAVDRLISSTLDRIAWYATPVEVRTNDARLAEVLDRASRWHGFAIVVHDHQPLEDARRDLQTRPGDRSIALWL